MAKIYEEAAGVVKKRRATASERPTSVNRRGSPTKDALLNNMCTIQDMCRRARQGEEVRLPSVRGRPGGPAPPPMA